MPLKKAVMSHTVPNMVMPGQPRKGIWNSGICQIMICRSCNESCVHCSQGSDLAGRPAMMSVEQFRQACMSLESYFGIVGVFGGNPTTHPEFDKICEVMRGIIPFARRGLWSNALLGKGAHARVTFNPARSNLNCHLSREAYDEFARDWPESIPFLRGMDQDSVHGAPFVAIKDVVPDEAERWRMIGDCDVNKHWSSCIGTVNGELRAYFCELAYAQAALHADNPDWDGTGRPMPDTSVKVEPNWWKRPQKDFEAQIRLHCQACGIALRRPPVPAVGGDHSEFSETHRHIARPKTRGRAVQFVGVENLTARPDRPATEYLSGVTPGYKG